MAGVTPFPCRTPWRKTPGKQQERPCDGLVNFTQHRTKLAKSLTVCSPKMWFLELSSAEKCPSIDELSGKLTMPA